MYIKKFDVLDDNGKTQGYGFYNDVNGEFGVLSKPYAICLAKKGKLKPYNTDGKRIYAKNSETSLWHRLSGRYKISQLSLDRCSQYQGYANIKYLNGEFVTIIGDYVYMEGKHNRLYMVGTLYVPKKYISRYGEIGKYLASMKCTVRSSGVYALSGGNAVVSFNNVFDFKNLLIAFNRGGFVMDLTHIAKFDYDIAGESEMYKKICENEHKGLYFSELDAKHHFKGVVTYARGISDKRLGITE